MALRDRTVKEIRLPDQGVNMRDAIEDMKPGEALLTQNCYFRRGVNKKPGSSKHSTNAVTASKRIRGLHRFYYAANSRQLIAAAGVNVKHLNEATGAWEDIRTIQTDDRDTHITTWGAVNKAYIANATDAPFSWDGTTAMNLSAFPVATKMVLPYRDVLLFIDTLNPTYIRQSNTGYDDTGIATLANSIRITRGGALQVIAPHAISGSQEGIFAYVFCATGGSILLFSASNMATSGGDRRLDHISDEVGCISPHTVKSTPKGTIFLGSDGQVYLMPFGLAQIIPIGHNIISGDPSTDGLESIPSGPHPDACAIYEDGFYKLAFAGSGSATNNTQYWLNVDRMFQDDRGRWGPWYGPMLGMAPSMFVNQNGQGDDGKLIAGDSNATGLVFNTNQPSVFSDDGASINLVLKMPPKYFADNKALYFWLVKLELELKDVTGTVLVHFHDTNKSLSLSNALSLLSSRIEWGQQNWGTFNWQGTGDPVRQPMFLYDKQIVGRGIIITISQDSSTQDFQLYTLQAEGKALKQTFPSYA